MALMRLGGQFSAGANTVVNGAKLRQVSLYYRPMDVRYSDNGNTASSYYSTSNLNSSLSAGVTAANYMATATLLKTLTLNTPL